MLRICIQAFGIFIKISCTCSAKSDLWGMRRINKMLIYRRWMTKIIYWFHLQQHSSYESYHIHYYVVYTIYDCIIAYSKCLWPLYHFYPRPVLASGILVTGISVCLPINHQLVDAITFQAYKLESPNLDLKCKTTQFRILSFWVLVDLDPPGQI